MDVNPQPTPVAKPTRSELTGELARPSQVGLRSAWTWRPLAALTPAQVADVLRRASQGDATEFLVAAADIEEKDLHYRAVLQTRKLAVAGLPLVVTPADDSPAAAKAADLVRAQFEALDMTSVCLGLLDAIAKGYAVSELVWATQGSAGAGQWQVAQVLAREPQWFVWDRDTGRELRLADGTLQGAALPAYKFMLHAPGSHSAVPVMGGIARSALWAWVFKSYALRDWARFCELFGQPVRIGKYDASASPADVAILRRAVFELGSDAAAILPQSMAVELVESGSKTASAEIYARLIDYLDAQVSKCVLGQTLTTDAGKSGSLAQAKVHDDVRADLLKYDARALAHTLRAGLAAPMVALNLGPAAPVPRIELHVADAEDLQALSDQVLAMVSAGLPVPMRWVREKWDIPEPEAGEAVLGAPAAPTVPAVPAPAQASHQAQVLPAIHATDPAAGSADPTPVTALAQAMAEQAAPAWNQVMSQVQTLAAQAQSLPELRDALLGAYGHLDVADLALVMGLGQAVADLAGRFDIQHQQL